MNQISSTFGRLAAVETGTGIPSHTAFTQHGEARRVTIQGFDAYLRKLQELPQRLRTQIARKAVNSTADMILAAVLARTPVLSGRLRAGMKKTAARVRRGVGRLVQMPDRASIGLPPDALYHPYAALEYGHASPGYGVYNTRTKKRIRRTGLKHIPARSFLRAGFDAVEKAAESNLLRMLDAGLAAEFAK